MKWRPDYNWQLITSDSITEPLLWNSSTEELLRKSARLDHCEQKLPSPTELKMSEGRRGCKLCTVDLCPCIFSVWLLPCFYLRLTPRGLKRQVWAPSRSTWRKLVGQLPKQMTVLPVYSFFYTNFSTECFWKATKSPLSPYELENRDIGKVNGNLYDEYILNLIRKIQIRIMIYQFSLYIRRTK